VLARVSTMLRQGKVVAWFQGALTFGPRSLGTRSVLCDPSNRYARHNVNEFYRQVSLDEPLPVVLSPAAARTMSGATDAHFPVFDNRIDAAWRDKLVSALDSRQRVRVHTLAPDQAPELQGLLDYHYAQTGVPGLIETNLSAPGETLACTPREAVRITYASAIDALIIGNFVLMKDYWLLRSDAR
jgi:carbamoyltransferase